MSGVVGIKNKLQHTVLDEVKVLAMVALSGDICVYIDHSTGFT